MKNILILFSIILLHSNLQGFGQVTEMEDRMVKVAILYPNEAGKTFDMDYYSTRHMPMVAQLFGEHLKGMTIDKGIAGRTPEEPVPFLAIGTFYFNSLEDYGNAFGPNAEKILSDIPNYTDITPIVQMSEVIYDNNKLKKDR